jgi:hypothetical protein
MPRTHAFISGSPQIASVAVGQRRQHIGISDRRGARRRARAVLKEYWSQAA